MTWLWVKKKVVINFTENQIVPCSHISLNGTAFPQNNMTTFYKPLICLRAAINPLLGNGMASVSFRTTLAAELHSLSAYVL